MCWRNLGLDEPEVTARELPFFEVFVLDIKELTKKLEIDVNSNPTICNATLRKNLIQKTYRKSTNLEAMLKKENFNAELELQGTYIEATNVIDMRMRQEYETLNKPIKYLSSVLNMYKYRQFS